MRNEVGNTLQREDSNPISTAETMHRNGSSTQTNAYNLTYHVKQWGKGLMVFGAGLLGYVGFNAFLTRGREASTLETKQEMDDNLAFPGEDYLNMQAKISDLPTALDHPAPKEFVPMSFSTSRTLLSIKVQKDKKNSAALNYRYTQEVEKAQIPLSQLRRSIPAGYEDGAKFRVNTYTTNNQDAPAVTHLIKGGFVVVWTSNGQVASSTEVYGQRFNATGQPVGSEFRVNINAIDYQQNPSVTYLMDGGFVVVWESRFQDGSSFGVYGKRYDGVGVPVGGEFLVNTYKTDAQEAPAVTGLTDGGFMVVWQSDGQDGSSGSVYGQRYDGAGLPAGSEFQVNTYANLNQYAPAVTGLTDGGCVVVWHSEGQDGSGFGVYGQRYNATSQPVNSEFQVNTYTVNHQMFPAVTYLTKGGFVVVWASWGQDSDDYGIYGQRYNATGFREGAEFQANTYATSAQSFPRVSSLTAGGFVVVWQSDGQDGSLYGVYGQHFNETGYPADVEFQANTYTTLDQRSPVVSNLIEGAFVVVWQSDGQDGDLNGVYARIYAPSIVKIITNFLVITEGMTISITQNQLRAAKPLAMDNNNITFTVNKLQHGRFEMVDQSGVPISTFTQQDIIDDKIKFTQDGSSIEPAFDIKVNDQSYQAGVISFIPINDAPRLIKNRLEITQGTSVIITPSYLLAMDEDNNNATLLFITQNVTYGRFENINDIGIAVIKFTQQQVTDKEIQFTHDRTTRLAPSYVIKVSDGIRESIYQPVKIIFNPGINLDWVASFLITSSLLACLCVTVAGVCLITAGGIYLAKTKKYRKSAYDIELETLEGTITLSPFLHKFNIDSRDIKLIEKIGQGGEAAVYLAKWSNKTVAYKVTRIIDASAIAEFETEAKIMLESNHPNIVHVYRICLTPKRIGLVMEFMALGSLKAAIQKKSLRLTWDTLWNIAYDLATVTAFLHKQDIVHRDIKTDNLLLYQDDEGEIHAKLADFGLSKRKQVSDASVTMRIGTYKYMAPEMMLGDGHYSEKACDVYAIGMTFVALINQEEPYPKMRGEMFLPGAVGRGERWQKLSKKNYDPTFFKLTNLCRSIDPSERPTAKELVKQLKEIEEPLAIFEEDEILNQTLSPPSTLKSMPASKDIAIATKTTAISTAPQTFFSAQHAEKRNSWDSLIDALDRQIKKAQTVT